MDTQAETDLHGAIDIHVHAAPDVRPRKTDWLTMAGEARAAGMRGFVLKNHHVSTVAEAALVRAAVPGIETWGGIALNHAVGGVNPHAVEAALKMGGAVVWMPTASAEHERAFYDCPGTGLMVVDESGRLTDEAHEVVRLVAAHDAVLALGHVSPHEMTALVSVARAAGVGRIVVNHPEIEAMDLPIDFQRSLAGAGLWFERCFVRPDKFASDWDGVAAAIRALGVATTILATDLGQPASPHPIAGLRTMLAELGRRGFSPDELRAMACDNPGRLLQGKGP
jgi:hypothetical protein